MDLRLTDCFENGQMIPGGTGNNKGFEMRAILIFSEYVWEIKRIYTFVGLLALIPTLASAFVFLPTYKEGRTAIIQDEVLTFITHASTRFNPGATSKEGIEALAQFSQQNSIPIYFAVTPSATKDLNEAGKYLLTPEHVSHTLVSNGGRHKLRFPNLRTVFIGGGNVSMCLCETIRDLVRGVLAYRNSQLNIVFVRDAIYEGDRVPATYLITGPILDSYVKREILPGFTCIQNHSNSPHPDLSGYSLDLIVDNVFQKRYEFYNNPKSRLIEGKKIKKRSSDKPGTIKLSIISSSQLDVTNF